MNRQSTYITNRMIETVKQKSIVIINNIEISEVQMMVIMESNKKKK